MNVHPQRFGVPSKPRNGRRGRGLDARRIDRLCEVIDAVLATAAQNGSAMRFSPNTEAVRASLADAAAARRIAREMGQSARKGA